MGASPSGARAAPSASLSSSPAVAVSAHAHGHVAARRVVPSRPPPPPPPPQNSTAVARRVVPTRPPPPPPPAPQNYSVSTASARRVVPTRPPPPPPPQINYSVSTAAAARSSGHHVFRIRDYSLLKAITPNGKSIKSTSFVVGGHSWHVEYYPNGYDADHTAYVSVFLVLEDGGGGAGEPVNVQLRFRFVDASNHGLHAPPPSIADMRGEKVRDFDGQGNGWGTVAFKKKEKLEEEGLIVEDGLVIRCDIVVITQSCTETTTTTTTAEAKAAAAAALASSSGDEPPASHPGQHIRDLGCDPRPRTKMGEEMFSPIKDMGVNPVYSKWRCSPPLIQ